MPAAFADRLQQRFAADKHVLIATLRADGSPRLSGTEVTIIDDVWWLGSMPGSRKSADMRRDPRVALHSALQPAAEGMTLGDAKLNAVAHDRTGTDDQTMFIRVLTDERGNPPPPGPFDLFRLEIQRASIVSVDGMELVIEAWSPATGVTTTRRA
jgi:Pyridoxamine 5'-phosphate oxidase